MIGFFVSISKLTARMMHADSHDLQPIHLSGFRMTPPPVRNSSASLGQTSIHAGSGHARHTIAIKLLSIPPVVRTLMALFTKE